MIRRRPRGETTFSKPTYDRVKPKYNPPSPDQLKADQDVKKLVAEKNRTFDKQVTKVGLARALFPEKIPPREPIKRRI